MFHEPIPSPATPTHPVHVIAPPAPVEPSPKSEKQAPSKRLVNANICKPLLLLLLLLLPVKVPRAPNYQFSASCTNNQKSLTATEMKKKARRKRPIDDDEFIFNRTQGRGNNWPIRNFSFFKKKSSRFLFFSQETKWRLVECRHFLLGQENDEMIKN